MATVYKLGNRGEEVKKIQRLLVQAGYGNGLEVDGVFGPRTDAAVRAFQRARGIRPVDGIVGQVTMGELMKKDDLPVTKGYIYAHITRCANRPLKYIAIHYTAGVSSKAGAAMSSRSVFLNRSASADYVVDDGTIVQITPDVRNYYCWAVGDKKNPYTGGGRLYGTATNKNTISVEICSNLKNGTTAAVPNHDGWYFTDASLDNARRLVRWLMITYGIPKDRVVRHYDISGKACPGVVGWNDAALYATDGKATARRSDSSRWTAFLASI